MFLFCYLVIGLWVHLCVQQSVYGSYLLVCCLSDFISLRVVVCVCVFVCLCLWVFRLFSNACGEYACARWDNARANRPEKELLGMIMNCLGGRRNLPWGALSRFHHSSSKQGLGCWLAKIAFMMWLLLILHQPDLLQLKPRRPVDGSLFQSSLIKPQRAQEVLDHLVEHFASFAAEPVLVRAALLLRFG